MAVGAAVTEEGRYAVGNNLEGATNFLGIETGLALTVTGAVIALAGLATSAFLAAPRRRS